MDARPDLCSVTDSNNHRLGIKDGRCYGNEIQSTLKTSGSFTLPYKQRSRPLLVVGRTAG